MKALRVVTLFPGPRPLPRESTKFQQNVQSRRLSDAIGATTETNSRLDALRSLFQFPAGRLNLRQLDQLQQLVTLVAGSQGASRGVWEMGLVPTLVELQDCGQPDVEKKARLALSLLGHAPPFAGRGLRILSVDGGGTRGLIPTVILRRLEELCGQQTYRMFDYVCGTSTGAILLGLLCIKRSSISEIQDTYRELSTKVFKMNNLLGISQLFLNHAFYDTKLLQEVIRRDPLGEQLLYETVNDPLVPRLSIVSTVVSEPVIQPFLFCNYQHRPDVLQNGAHYLTAADVTVWEAIMASTAAPGYFEEVKLGSYVHQDGGLLTNNPCAAALHEARLIWGRTAPIQCVISLGTGLYCQGADKKALGNTSLREKLTKIVASATDTEAVHTILSDLLPPDVYFRFQPQLSEDVPIDESRPEKLEQLVWDTCRYLEGQGAELGRAASALSAVKSPHQRAQDWASSRWNRVLCRSKRVFQSK